MTATIKNSRIIHQEVEVKPLSVNALFRGRRFKTNNYKEYEKELLYLLPKEKKITGNIAITLEFYLKNYSRTDVDNLAKGILDILKKAEYIEDDRKVTELHLYKYQSKINRIRITISKP